MSNETKAPFEGGERFDVIERIGEGGMGSVYSAYDTLLKERVALKTLKERSSESLLLLKNEFRLLQDIRHPNLVSYGELFENEGAWFFSMELIRGTDFLSYVRERRR